MQKGMVACLLASAVLAVSCATLHKSMLTGIGIGVGAGAVTSMAMRWERESDRKPGGASEASNYLIHGTLASLTHAFRSQDHKLHFHLGSLHLGLQKRDAKTRRQTLLNLDKFSVSAPTRGQRAFGHTAGVQDFRLSAPDVDKECGNTPELAGKKPARKRALQTVFTSEVSEVWTIRGNATWQSNTRRR